MKKIKYVLPITLSIVIGLYLGKLVYNNYENNLKLKQAFSTNNKVYFLQQGVYSTKGSMSKNTTNLSDYIYVLDEDKYKVFVGINIDKNAIEKVKSIYNDKGIDIYVKQDQISDNAFIEKLKEYDKLISGSSDNSEILKYENQIMREYEVLYSGK